MTEDFIKKLMHMRLTGTEFRLILALSLAPAYNAALARMIFQEENPKAERQRSVQTLKALQDLIGLGIVTESHRIGKNIFYKLNPEFAEREEI